MKANPISLAGAILLILFCNAIKAQSFGTNASAVWLSDCNQTDFFNTTGQIGPAGNAFNNANLGIFGQNSGNLVLRGAQVNTFKDPLASNVCQVHMYYRVYLQSGVPGAFTSVDLSLLESCDISTNQFSNGDACVAGDQKWQRFFPNVDLTTHAPGNYVLEVYYDVLGNATSTGACNALTQLDNSGNNYKAFFSLQSPTLPASTNPSSCFGNQGNIIIAGLVPGASYQLTYTDDATVVGPAAFVANGSGQIIVTGLNAGFYSNFSVEANGCTSFLFTGVILSDPIFVPTFNTFAAFCAGTTAPILPATSNNGLTGTWNPAVVSNTASGAYTFTPAGGQCSVPITINITVTPRTTPTFPFGTSRTICAGGAVPTLPTTSSNGIPGTWTPSVVDNQNSGSYSFIPNAGQCANGTIFNVTVNPNITPTFTFGASATICAGTSAPTLPTTSTNSITGTWSPATVDNQNSGTYTFTPTAGLCAVPATFSVTVNPNVPPTFSFGNSLSLCAGGSVPALPITSTNGVTGTWSPAVVNDQSSGTYIFTPTGGLCALPFTFSVTVNPNITPTFSFGTSSTICAGAAVPTLPITSTNSITGTWSPATIDNQNSGTYTFTPTAGLCALPSTFTVTVNPNITPNFSFGTSSTVCAGTSVPALPTTSTNGITGTWSPASVDNQNSGTYTFTPTAGLCAVPTSFSVTVNPNVPPTFGFGSSLTICAGGTVPALPTTSANGVTGTWSPATVDNQNSGTYTFTPTAGLCAVPTTFAVTVNPNITPTFSVTANMSICQGGAVPTLALTSNNGITGTWSPATIDNQNSGTYTFTPTAGLCALPVTVSVTINPNITPTFSFGTSTTLCAGSAAPALPTTSANGITGTWSPATIDNQNSATYTFTPTAGLCAVGTTLAVTVDVNIPPTFSFGSTLTICAGGTVPALPTTSTNGIPGTWSPATVDNQNSGTYTFTPTPGLCAVPTTFAVTVNPNITPTFSFGTSMTVCENGIVPALPTTSTNSLTGTWSPATIDNQNSGTYTFTPTSGLCAVPTTFTVTVNPNVTPAFSFGAGTTICAGAVAPVLPATSSNGITGTWSPATVDNQNSATYTFTPNPGQCVIPPTVTFDVTITPNAIPAFSFGNSLTICTGGVVPTLPTTSTNGITGTWTPAVVNTQASGTYVFNAPAGQCVTPFTYTVTVNPIVTPTFSIGTSQSVCINVTAPVLPATSTNGIPGTWSPATVDNQNSATYTFTPAVGQCATNATFTYQVNPIPSIAVRADTTVYDGAIVPGYNYSPTPSGIVRWTNSNPAIGLPASGTGNIPSFTAINRGNTPITGTITVTPAINGCSGVTRQFIITVLPLDKDVFVPNVFSPNNDGKNDMLYVYGNYITKVDMRIFNQWGQQITQITNKTQGWDGRHKGNPQPVGVYVYVLKAELADGRIVNLKGSITLVR